MSSYTQSWSRLDKAAAGLLLALILTHFVFLNLFAVNIPYWDEWAIYTPDVGMLRMFELKWYFEPHNEHPVLLTKIFAVIHHFLHGRTPWGEHWINFSFYIGFIAILWRTALKEKLVQPWVASLFVIFWAGPLAFFNLVHRYHNGWHFSLFFATLSAYFLFQKPVRIGWGILAGLGAHLCFGNGLVFAGVLFILKTLELAVSALHLKRQRQPLPINLYKKWLLGIALFVVAITIDWQYVRVTPMQHDPSYPWQARFWVFVTNLIANGFGIETPDLALACICTFIVVAPLFILLFAVVLRPHKKYSEFSWFWPALSAAILVSCCAMTYARGFSGPEGAKSYRFFEVPMALVPLALFSWVQVGQLLGSAFSQRVRWAPAVAAYVFTFICMSPQWDFYVYKMRNRTLSEGRECLKQSIESGKQEIICKQLFHGDLRRDLNVARQLGESFLEGIEFPKDE